MASNARPPTTNGHNHDHPHPQSHSHETTPLLPTTNHQHDAHHNEGESGRSGFHPTHFLTVLYHSSCTASKYVNLLWPFVLVAFLLQVIPHQNPLAKFIMAYIAVVPTANLLG